jgi:adenosine deaminase
MHPPYGRDLIAALPKTDLHCHLDGSLRLGTLIDLARGRDVALPSSTPEGLQELVFKETYRDLPDYLHGFAYTCAVLRDAEALERVAYELADDCLAEGVCYLEVRFAPQLLTHERLSLVEVLQAVDRGLDRRRREHEATPEVRAGLQPPFRYGLVACAMRMFTKGFGPYYAQLLDVLAGWPAKSAYSIASQTLARQVVEARDRLGLPIVGFDLAGAEEGNPASDHADAYHYVHRHFLKKTVHAGEAYGPESIFQAITKLDADRIGHGTRLFDADAVSGGSEHGRRYVQQLAEYIADRRIVLEVCVTSNLQTMPHLRRVEDHPVGRMIKERLSVSIATDNRLVSRTTSTDELLKVANAFRLDPEELRNVVLHGFKRSFYPGSYLEKRAYVRQVIDVYDRVAVEHGMPRPSRVAVP